MLYLKDYANYIKDDFVTELTDIACNMLLSVDIITIPTDEAIREVGRRLLGVETNITNWQRKQNRNNNFSATIPYDMELFTTGSLDIFGHSSTVDFIDEFHVMFENEFSASFFTSAWRQFRKRNAYPTAITQNVEYLLDSVQASTMLSNSEFIVMLNQAAGDREKLAHLLNISNEQLGYITNAPAGCGLIKYGAAIVPFVNNFPKDTELYRLMTTKPGEGNFAAGDR